MMKCLYLIASALYDLCRCCHHSWRASPGPRRVAASRRNPRVWPWN